MKAVMTIKELAAEGYPEIDLRHIANSKDFPKVGFRANAERSKIYFFTKKLDKYLERRMKQE